MTSTYLSGARQFADLQEARGPKKRHAWLRSRATEHDDVYERAATIREMAAADDWRDD
jgi:hypothetical protein